MPKLTIILPVYNAEKYLDLCLASILGQSFDDFIVVCINDGSNDNSLKVINKYATKDSRIKVISRENKGLIYTLNEGLGIARTKYVARMDADDICQLERFEKQIQYMEKRKLAFCGTSYSIIDENGDKIKDRIPPRALKDIRSLMLFGSAFCHPSMMFNRELLGEDLFYNEDYIHVEDLELWFKLLERGHAGANLKEILLNYRVVQSSISSLNIDKQREKSIALTAKYTNLDEIDVLHLRKNTSSVAKINIILRNFYKVYNWSGIYGFLFALAYCIKVDRKYSRY